jgi:hypothetical protein
MSKAPKPCSSCPAAAAAAEKASTPKGNKIKFVLEDTLPTSSDSVIKVKNFKKFLDYDLKTLNITGELQTYIHRNGLTHIKMAVTYQDKTTNKVNYLELDFLDNTNKEENRRFAFCACDSGCNNGNCFGGVVSAAPPDAELLKLGRFVAAGANAGLSFSSPTAGAVTIVLDV